MECLEVIDILLGQNLACLRASTVPGCVGRCLSCHACGCYIRRASREERGQGASRLLRHHRSCAADSLSWKASVGPCTALAHTWVLARSVSRKIVIVVLQALALSCDDIAIVATLNFGDLIRQR